MSDLLALLTEFHREKLAMMMRHIAGARIVSQYDANNTYQYIVNREEAQLSWLESAIAELGGTPAAGGADSVREAAKGGDATHAAAREDALDAEGFVKRWRTRVESMTNARHRGMLRVILGETLEHQRFFEQAAAGDTDLLGRRTDVVGPRVGEVLSTRWIE